MHAVRSCGHRDVGPIVDEHLRARPFDHIYASPHERGQLSPLEIALPNLDQIDAGARSGRYEVDEAIDVIGRNRETPAIGHQANHDCSIVSIVSIRRRVSSTDASSLKPISRFTTPRPDTAPLR